MNILTEVLNKLCPNCQYSVYEGNVIWLDDPLKKPSQQVIDQEILSFKKRKERQPIKQACSKRILSVVKDRETQDNINSHMIMWTRKVLSGTADDNEIKMLNIAEDIVKWIHLMVITSRSAKLTDSWQNDSYWPAPPEDYKLVTDLL